MSRLGGLGACQLQSRTMPRAAIIIPTYDEALNIERMVRTIWEVTSDTKVLVVDDNSPDGTGEIVRQLEIECSERVELYPRPGKLGLGTAYIEGFTHLLKDPAIECILGMDADFSHDPAYLPAMIEKLETADVAIGSRYLQGISVVNWPLRRLALSYFANRYARAVTGLGVTDCTSGFVGYRRKVLETIDYQSIRLRGYSFLIAMKYKAKKAGFTLGEVPIIFYERRDGQTKMSRAIMIEAATAVWKLRLLG